MELPQPVSNPITQSPMTVANCATANPTTEPPPRNLLFVGGVGMLVLAAFLLLCGMCSTMLYLVMPFVEKNRSNAIETNIVFGLFAAVGILFGAVVGWQGIVTVRGRASLPAAHAFPPGLLLIIVFFLALGLGSLIPGNTPFSAYIFPPWHLLAAALPPLAYLAYAAHRLGATSGLRALVISFGWGALGGTPVALLLEIAIGVIMVVVVAVALSFAPDSAVLLERLRTELRLSQATNDLTTLRQLLSNPAIVGAVLLYVVGIVPIIEEAVKTLIVAFADPRRTRQADALLWGISAGAGFAVVEGVLNVSAGLTIWAAAMMLRVGATTMHVANGATMARGWYAARVERRWSRLVIAYGVSVFAHAIWNAAVVVFAGSAIFLVSNPSPTTEMLLPAGLLIAAMVMVWIILTSIGMVWVAHSVRSLRTVREPAQ